MSRFLGSMFKRSRRFGISLLENNKEFSKGKKRTTAPGQHGAKRVKMSDYQLHLYENDRWTTTWLCKLLTRRIG